MPRAGLAAYPGCRQSLLPHHDAQVGCLPAALLAKVGVLAVDPLEQRFDFLDRTAVALEVLARDAQMQRLDGLHLLRPL